MIIPLRDQILSRIMATSEMMTLRGTATLMRDRKGFDFWEQRIEKQLKQLRKAFEEYPE